MDILDNVETDIMSCEYMDQELIDDADNFEHFMERTDQLKKMYPWYVERFESDIYNFIKYEFVPEYTKYDLGKTSHIGEVINMEDRVNFKSIFLYSSETSYNLGEYIVDIIEDILNVQVTMMDVYEVHQFIVSRAISPLRPLVLTRQ